jgi:hypothetical protein
VGGRRRPPGRDRRSPGRTAGRLRLPRCRRAPRRSRRTSCRSRRTARQSRRLTCRTRRTARRSRTGGGGRAGRWPGGADRCGPAGDRMRSALLASWHPHGGCRVGLRPGVVGIDGRGSLRLRGRRIAAVPGPPGGARPVPARPAPRILDGRHEGAPRCAYLSGGDRHPGVLMCPARTPPDPGRLPPAAPPARGGRRSPVRPSGYGDRGSPWRTCANSASRRCTRQHIRGQDRLVVTPSGRPGRRPDARATHAPSRRRA